MGKGRKGWNRSERSMNVILIGMRGSGKSTIAKKLSRKLNKPYAEVDKLIAEKARISIPEMVRRYGWEYFRELEAQMTKDICQNTDMIIATGGGVVTRPENVETIKQAGKVIYLKAQISTLLHRVGIDPNRPALTNKKNLKEEMTEVLRQREELYESTANLIIDTDKKTTRQIVEEIVMSS